ncbi:hypothetical protein CWO91_34790 [Bradyrhizobium genosp. SA-3]|nr:hypothetical protein CWO91_34790 [Bradyrhizobium genosp. SA-3]
MAFTTISAHSQRIAITSAIATASTTSFIGRPPVGALCEDAVQIGPGALGAGRVAADRPFRRPGLGGRVCGKAVLLQFANLAN